MKRKYNPYALEKMRYRAPHNLKRIAAKLRTINEHTQDLPELDTLFRKVVNSCERGGVK